MKGLRSPLPNEKMNPHSTPANGTIIPSNFPLGKLGENVKREVSGK
jgi:hypothetical protein